MPAQASPSLLAVYLAAAARQACDGELSARSRWAVTHAQYQLRTSRDVLTGDEPFVETATGAGLRKVEANGGADLAELALSGSPDAGGGGIEDIETRAAARLESVLNDLEAIGEGKASEETAQAAKRLTDIFASSPRSAAA